MFLKSLNNSVLLLYIVSACFDNATILYLMLYTCIYFDLRLHSWRVPISTPNCKMIKVFISMLRSHEGELFRPARLDNSFRRDASSSLRSRATRDWTCSTSGTRTGLESEPLRLANTIFFFVQIRNESITTCRTHTHIAKSLLSACNRSTIIYRFTLNHFLH